MRIAAWMTTPHFQHAEIAKDCGVDVLSAIQFRRHFFIVVTERSPAPARLIRAGC